MKDPDCKDPDCLVCNPEQTPIPEAAQPPVKVTVGKVFGLGYQQGARDATEAAVLMGLLLMGVMTLVDSIKRK